MCNRSTDMLDLLISLLYARPIRVTNQTSVNLREKQSFSGVLSLKWDFFNTYEIREISSDVDQLKMHQKHLVAAAKGLAKTLGMVQQYQIYLEQAIYQMRDIFSLEIRGVRITSGNVDSDKISRDPQFSGHFVEGICSAMKKVSSCHLVDPGSMKRTLSDLIHKALKNN